MIGGEPAAYEQAAETLRLLSDSNRLRILSVLARAETCVCDLIDDVGLSQTLVSYHLAKLRKAGLVRVRREAQWSYYSLDPEAWAASTAPLAALFDPRPLPPEAAYGANRRCDPAPVPIVLTGAGGGVRERDMSPAGVGSPPGDERPGVA